MRAKALFPSLVICVALVTLLGAPPASAAGESPSPWWGVSSGARPTVLAPAGSGQIVVTAENRGDGDANGGTTPVRILDTLPAGLKAVAIEGRAGAGEYLKRAAMSCSPDPASEIPLKCTFDGVVHPYEPLEMRISVEVEEDWAPGGENTAGVSGGGAVGEASVSRPVQVGGQEGFGVEESQFVPEEADGRIDTQAGSHPFQLTSVVTFNQGAEAPNGEVDPVEMPREVGVLTPPGVVGNPTPFAQCTDVQLTTLVKEAPTCPADTIVGVANITFSGGGLGYYTSVTPVYNMVPEAGEPARFAFYATVFPVFLDTSVRTGGDYGVTVSSHDITEIGGIVSSKVTLWGVPGDPRHDSERGFACLLKPGSCSSSDEAPSSPPPPFLSLPTSCTGPLAGAVQASSWVAPKEVLSEAFTEQLPSLDGCDELPFTPSIAVAPDAGDASSPTGLTVAVHVSQTAALNPTGNAESTLRDTTVTLPAGVTLNPAGANGLQACSESQIGFEAGRSSPEHLMFTPSYPACPDASKIGTVEIETPLLPHALTGAVYLATPAPSGEEGMNPFKSLLAMYIVAQDPVSGVLVKLPGEARPDPVTGQIVSTFDNTPQLPFETLRLHFFGGETAPLGSPAACGSYTTAAAFTPWSGEPPVETSSMFSITTGPHSGPCEDPLPFAPSLTAGSTNIQAGAFSPFTMTMSREDGNQSLQAIRLRMPPGLLGTLASVELCPEPQASQGTCGPGSLIGETTVSVGLGGDPYSVKGGRVYITGPYEGAPFGLSIVNPAKAGPFDLERGKDACDCVLVRAKIEIDPRTSVLTITSDDSGPYKIPSILDGVPLQIKHVNVTVTRPGFTFNPTNCAPLAVTGSLSSTEGATAALAVPFQVTNCATLAFNPKFAVSTSGKTSRHDGASLDVKLAYPKAAWGSQANVRSVKVDLPKQLPSRLTTLQKACPAATFEADPAACPAGSRVGFVRVITPVVPVALSGPAYFVSYGGAKFPELVFVLQGYGVTVDVHGETFISKAGITSSTIRAVPDVPFDSFELTLPQGSDSALAANGDLCTSKLRMPSAFTAQNGLEIRQSTPIAVTGCAKNKHKGNAKKSSRKH